ncbi:MAG: hypothetical protein HZA00_10505 [Nitrospinae bacterium]|nr:hypothetical protein [Nitrospinota bacterium]
MTIQSCISELQKLGYHLYLDGAQIKYKCLSLIEPPKDKVIPLLDTLKRNRQAVIDYLKPNNTSIPFDTLSHLYQEAFSRIPAGLKVNWQRVIEFEADRLEPIWRTCMEGKATIEDFKDTLNKWSNTIQNYIQKGVM